GYSVSNCNDVERPGRTAAARERRCQNKVRLPTRGYARRWRRGGGKMVFREQSHRWTRLRHTSGGEVAISAHADRPWRHWFYWHRQGPTWALAHARLAA